MQVHIPISAILGRCPFIPEGSPGGDGLLGETRHTVTPWRTALSDIDEYDTFREMGSGSLYAMEMDAGIEWQMVAYHNLNIVAIVQR